MAVFLNDTFTEATSTPLHSHTPNTGGAWVQRNINAGGATNAATVTGGTGNLNAGGGEFFYTNAATPAGTDHYGETVWTPSSFSFVSIIFGWTAQGTCYQAVIDKYSNEIRFERLNNWAPTVLGTPYAISLPNGTFATLRYELTVEGANKRLKLFFDGVERINVVDTSPLAGVGLVGIRMDGGDCTSLVAGDIGGGGPATAITLSGPSSGTVGVASSNFTAGANGTITGTVTVTPSDGGDGGTFAPTSVAISSGTPTATFTYTAASAGSPTATITVTNNGSLTNPAGIAYTATAPAATSLVVTVPDAAGLSGFSAAVLSTSTPTTGSTVIKTATSITFNGSGQATIDITGLGLAVGARRWVTLTNSNGDPAQTPAPKQAAGPVTAS